MSQYARRWHNDRTEAVWNSLEESLFLSSSDANERSPAIDGFSKRSCVIEWRLILLIWHFGGSKGCTTNKPHTFPVLHQANQADHNPNRIPDLAHHFLSANSMEVALLINLDRSLFFNSKISSVCSWDSLTDPTDFNAADSSADSEQIPR